MGRLRRKDALTLPAAGLGMTLAYAALSRLSLEFVAEPHEVATIWPANGAALAALVLGGRRLRPALAAGILGGYLLAAVAPRGVGLALALGTVNALEIVAASMVLGALLGQRRVALEPRTVAAFAVTATGVTAVAALAGAAILHWTHDVALGRAWTTWWLADAMGMLVVAPALLLVRDRRGRGATGWKATAAGGALVGMTALVFLGPHGDVGPLRFTYLVFPPLLVAATVLRPRHLGVALLAVGVLASLATAHEAGPFLHIADGGDIVALQGFLAVAVLCALLVGAVAREHREGVTALRNAHHQLQHVADHDALTGLLNRRSFVRALEAHLHDATSQPGCVVVLDVDGFKEINDTLGHAAGDRLIGRVADVLRTTLRRRDLLARLGGDEFAVLLPDLSPAEGMRTAERLLAALRRERIARRPGGSARPVTASAGVVAAAGGQARDADAVLVCADLAMYDAKEGGRDRAVAYGAANGGVANVEVRIAMAERIRAALEEERLVLHAQPVVALDTRVTCQHELLIRMVDEDGSLVPPDAFLPVAERFGLIGAIDRWVVTHAIRMLADQARLGHRPVFEVNLSGHSLDDLGLVDLIEHETRTGGVDPRQLILEVTETAAVANVARAQELGRRLTEIGCRFALDDFGAGFGSFYYLKHLPFDLVKIDGEFIRQCAASETDRLMIEAIVGVAVGLGKETVAEFVEDATTIATLRELGVTYGQGFHLGRPVPLAEALGDNALRAA